MEKKKLDMMNELLSSVCDTPPSRAVFLCEGDGTILTGYGHYTKEEQHMLSELAVIILPGTKRMAREISNENEAQGMSIGDDVHILSFWLKDRYFLIFLCNEAQSPHAPPKGIIDICNQLRKLI